MASQTTKAAPSTTPEADTAEGANTAGDPPINVAKVPDPTPPPSTPPGFLSEGTAQELILTGRATDPRTGAQLDPAILPPDRVSPLEAPPSSS